MVAHLRTGLQAASNTKFYERCTLAKDRGRLKDWTPPDLELFR